MITLFLVSLVAEPPDEANEGGAVQLRVGVEGFSRNGTYVNGQRVGTEPLPVKDGVYLAHENCPQTYNARNRDHPSMLMALGWLPGDGVDTETMRRTLKKVMAEWKWDDTWGWDYPMIAMTGPIPKLATSAKPRRTSGQLPHWGSFPWRKSPGPTAVFPLANQTSSADADRLRQSQNAAKREREMAKFADHPPLLGAVFHSAGGGAAPCAGFQWPARFNASATSGGI